MAEIKAVDPQIPDPHIILRAAGVLKSGGLVAFPTETVYGLGADATNPVAIGKIFAAKGRPATNPLIIHCESIYRIRRQCVAEWPESASILASHFWPGPMTLILPKSKEIPDIATAGLGFAGVRIPESRVALALIEAADRPIAAPSANRSNRLSPTRAEHVARDLGDRIDMIIDAGACRAGVESTVLDLSGPSPVILRPGPITAAQIAQVLNRPVLANQQQASGNAPLAAPGQLAIHYAPKKLLTFWLKQKPEASFFQLDHAVMWLGQSQAHVPSHATVQAGFSDVKSAEAWLYHQLHQWDANDLVREIHVVIEPTHDEDWSAVIDRLSRAARVIL
ncbi:MAG: L-threonylcarbamoyladenylate synthase [bacterium]